MSLKNRLLKNREIKSQQFASINSDCDLLNFFREHKEFDTITAYNHDKIFGEKDGNKVKLPISFSSKESYSLEVEKIAKLYDNFPDKKNPEITICTPGNSIIKIIVPPIVEDEPFISFRRKNKKLYTSYFSTKVLSSEIVAYLRDCLAQKANIFIIGNASTEKTLLMNFLINLTDNSSKNIICGETENITVDNRCLINLNQDYLDEINEFDYDNIFYLNEKNKNITKIFQLILSGHNGFVISLSLKNNVDILPAIRNLILLENMNLFEENADFLTASAIDTVITLDNSDFSISKISEVVKNHENQYSMKDIFIKTNEKTHVSTGNTSRFFNNENSQRYLKEFLEEGHKHSYVSGKTEVLTEPINASQNSNKHKKLKEKLKKLKKEKLKTIEKENIDLVQDVQQEEQIITQDNTVQSQLIEQNQEEQLTFFGKKIDEVNNLVNQNNVNTRNFDENLTQKPDFQTILKDTENKELDSSSDLPTLPKPKIANILNVDDELETPQEIVDNQGEYLVNEQVLDDDANGLQDETKNLNIEISEKYTENQNRIIEEPQLFSEITSDDVEEYERGILEVPDEDI